MKKENLIEVKLLLDKTERDNSLYCIDSEWNTYRIFISQLCSGDYYGTRVEKVEPNI